MEYLGDFRRDPDSVPFLSCMLPWCYNGPLDFLLQSAHGRLGCIIQRLAIIVVQESKRLTTLLWLQHQQVT